MDLEAIFEYMLRSLDSKYLVLKAVGSEAVYFDSLASLLDLGEENCMCRLSMPGFTLF